VVVPNPIRRTAISLAAVAVVIGSACFMAARSGYFDSTPVISRISHDAACATAASYAGRKLAEESFRDAAIDGCADVKMSEQPDGTWVARGGATATQYGAPVALTWTATIAAFTDDPAPRVCAFGITHSSNAFGPKSLDVRCRGGNL
jgi:hypothetical protein